MRISSGKHPENVSLKTCCLCQEPVAPPDLISALGHSTQHPPRSDQGSEPWHTLSHPWAVPKAGTRQHQQSPQSLCWGRAGCITPCLGGCEGLAHWNNQKTHSKFSPGIIPRDAGSPPSHVPVVGRWIQGGTEAVPGAWRPRCSVGLPFPTAGLGSFREHKTCLLCRLTCQGAPSSHSTG